MTDAQRKYNLTDKGRAKRRELNKRYLATNKGIAMRRRAVLKYMKSPKGKASHLISVRKYRRNPSVRILNSIRARLFHALKGANKSNSTLKFLGCSIESFKLYLESKFETGMSWENYGKHGWHIDHIMPCAIFDLTKSEHQKRCFHFSNLQPLWATENIRKGCKIATN